jgi:hypothetical protein
MTTAIHPSHERAPVCSPIARESACVSNNLTITPSTIPADAEKWVVAAPSSASSSCSPFAAEGRQCYYWRGCDCPRCHWGAVPGGVAGHQCRPTRTTPPREDAPVAHAVVSATWHMHFLFNFLSACIIGQSRTWKLCKYKSDTILFFVFWL